MSSGAGGSGAALLQHRAEPAAGARFIGRRAELQELRQLLEEHRAISLVGPRNRIDKIVHGLSLLD